MSVRSSRGVRGGIVGTLVVIALVLDRAVLLPGFEAGAGGMPEGAKVTVWLLVNLLPALVAGLLARAAGRGMAGATAVGAFVAVGTGSVLLILVGAYMAEGLA